MKMLLATLTAGAAVAAATALPATGQEASPSKTLTLTSVQAKGGERAIDTPPRGDSVGDRFVFASSLRRDGGLVGRMEGDCLAVDLKFEGMQCTLTAVLADGSITLQGASLTKHIPGATAPSQDVYSITGGTGAYVGASGTMRRSGNGKTDTDVFELR
jgi:Allene oxide cyclase barrel like domain